MILTVTIMIRITEDVHEKANEYAIGFKILLLYCQETYLLDMGFKLLL